MKPINGYENLYAVDEHGNVYSLVTTASRRKGVLKPHPKNGYLAVNLYKDGKVKHFYIHRLVAEAFIPNPENLPCVNHINANKQDNAVGNLEWCTQSENILHCSKLGRHKTPQYRINGRFAKRGDAKCHV